MKQHSTIEAVAPRGTASKIMTLLQSYAAEHGGLASAAEYAPATLGRVRARITILLPVEPQQGAVADGDQTAAPEHLRTSRSAQDLGTEPTELDERIDAVVRLIHRRGFMADIVTEEIYVLAAWLLHSAGIIDPGSDQPLSRTRTDELCSELEELDDEVDATSAPRTWVADKAGAVCAKITRAWTDSLRGSAETLAQDDRTPTRRYRVAQALVEDAETSWPAALQDVQAMLAAIAGRA